MLKLIKVMVKETAKRNPASRRSNSPTREFLGASLNMSWQLAVVVLVPILGGFQLDKLLDSLPAFTVLGFFAAMTGMGAVVWRQLQRYGKPSDKPRAKTNGS